MSAIAGRIDLQGKRSFEPQQTAAMLQAMRHRASGAQVMHHQPGAALGALHNLAANQAVTRPVYVSQDSCLLAAIDGCLFNRTELLQQLSGRLPAAENAPDTEILAQLYLSFGPGFLSRVDGEFAFFIWDDQQQRLFAGRDRLGVHHLFFTRQDGVLYLATEIKSILATGAVERRLDIHGLDQVLFMNTPVAPRTMFAGIQALPAGHFLIAEDGQVRHAPYWDLEFKPADAGSRKATESSRPEDRDREELLSLLRRAVEVRIPKDRPLGVYLSGGLDSSIITALIRESGVQHLPAYFADFCLPNFSERPHAQHVADSLGVPLNVVEMSFRSISENFPRLIWHGEAPLVLVESASLLPLARRAAQDVSTVLNGEGGDELMAGYIFNEWDLVYRKLQRFPLSISLPLIQNLLPRLGLPRAFVLSKQEQAAARQHFGCFPSPLYYNYTVRETTDFYSPETRERLAGYCPEAEIAQVLDVERMRRWDPLSQSLYFSTKINLPNYLLGPHGDRAVSSAGLEAHFPFLDYHLMEFAARLPNEFKLRGFKEKYLLKQAAAQVLPDSVIQRKKSPMTSPTSPAFLGPDALEYARHLLSSQVVREKGYFDPHKVSELVQRLQSRVWQEDKNNRMDVMMSFPLVAVLSVHVFDELFIQNFQPEPPAWN